jgi:hypothetical protein
LIIKFAGPLLITGLPVKIQISKFRPCSISHRGHREHRVKKNLLSVNSVLSVAKNILPDNGKILEIDNLIPSYLKSSTED